MLLRALLILLLLTGAAQAQQANQYLLFSTLADAQAADAAICQAQGCQLPTLYWLGGGDGGFNNCGQTAPGTACTPTSWALIVQQPPYDASNLTVTQQASLITEAQATAAGFPTPTWAAQQAAGTK